MTATTTTNNTTGTTTTRSLEELVDVLRRHQQQDERPPPQNRQQQQEQNPPQHQQQQPQPQNNNKKKKKRKKKGGGIGDVDSSVKRQQRPLQISQVEFDDDDHRDSHDDDNVKDDVKDDNKDEDKRDALWSELGELLSRYLVEDDDERQQQQCLPRLPNNPFCRLHKLSMRNVNLNESKRFRVYTQLANLTLSSSTTASNNKSSSSSSLKHLTLSNCNVTATLSRKVFSPSSSSATTIAVDFPFQQLHTLDLSDNAVGPRGARVVAELVLKGSGNSNHNKKKSSQLRRLDLSNAQLGHYGAQAIGSCLPTSLRYLNLADNNLGHDGLWKLVGGISRLRQLRELDLADNAVQDDGCLELSRHLGTGGGTCCLLRKLRRLNLSGNRIGPSGAEGLADGLLRLALAESSEAAEDADAAYEEEEGEGDESGGDSANEDGQEGEVFGTGTAAAMSDFAFPDDGNNGFDVTKTKMKTKGGGNDEEGTSANGGPSLRVLDLSNNPIGPDGTASIARALSKARFLETLNLASCRIDDDGATAIAEALVEQQQDDVEDSDDESDEDEDDEEEQDSGRNYGGKTARNDKFVGLLEIDLSGNDIGDLGAGAFCEHLDGTSVCALHLEGNARISEARMRILDMLVKHKQVTSKASKAAVAADTAATTSASAASTTTTLSSQLARRLALEEPQQEAEEEKKDGGNDGKGGGSVSDDNSGGVDEDEDDIEAGREALHGLFSFDDFDDDEEEGSSDDNAGVQRQQQQQRHGAGVVDLPAAYLRHLTGNFDSANALSYSGAFGPLYAARDDQDGEDWFVLPFVVRKLELGSAGPLKGARDKVLDDIRHLRDGTGTGTSNQLFLPVVAVTGTRTYQLIVYSVLDRNDASHRLQPLRSVLADDRQRARWTWRERIGVLRGIALALEALHAGDKRQGVSAPCFHGDVQPSNVFVSTPSGGGGGENESHHVVVAKLSDPMSSRLLATADRKQLRFASGEVVFGTRSYRCPRYERGAAQYDCSSDMFSFGVMLAEVLTGQLQRTKVAGNSNTNNAPLLLRDAYYDYVLTKQSPIRIDPAIGGASASSSSTSRTTSTLPQPSLQALIQIMTSCMSPIQHQRPSASTVATILDQLQA